ncbi:MAG TPA: cytochrome C oxidase subunit IV family protein [Candidatus Saccharimonadales bacterium]|nr:cytochrome C oxidase subunit IV family protein [Candidatus Saccharimonadales bacterium]HSX27437.1 cytochrome C oxidase subunit IV family protein [Patescibacteria group bacterium]
MTKREHGTTKSYIIGFILSLMFTLIPYYLVVNKTVTGNALLATILGVAVLQMFVQIFFFLHLGRGPKPFYNVVFFFATAGIIVIVIGASLLIMSNLYRNMSPGEVTKKLAQGEGIAQVGDKKTGACQGVKNNHLVTISSGQVNPAHTQAQLCDTLTFINKDDRIRDIAFGSHPHHEEYGGQAEENLRKGYPKTITLNQAGTYEFHDHLDPQVTGSFNVSP